MPQLGHLIFLSTSKSRGVGRLVGIGPRNAQQILVIEALKIVARGADKTEPRRDLTDQICRQVHECTNGPKCGIPHSLTSRRAFREGASKRWSRSLHRRWERRRRIPVAWSAPSRPGAPGVPALSVRAVAGTIRLVPITRRRMLNPDPHRVVHIRK
jgi:hypothetical protein